MSPYGSKVRRLLHRHRWRLVVIAVVVVGLVVGARLLTQASEAANRASEIETSLARRGVTGAGAQNLATALVEQGVSVDAASSVVAELRADFGGADLADLEAAQMLAAWEEAAPGAGAARVLGKVGAHQLGVTREGLADFVRTVTSEQRRRQLPPAVILAGLSEHVIEYRSACEYVEGAPCPLDAVLDPRRGSTASRLRAVGPRRLRPLRERRAPRMCDLRRLCQRVRTGTRRAGRLER